MSAVPSGNKISPLRRRKVKLHPRKLPQRIPCVYQTNPQNDENLKILKDFLSEDLSVNYDNYEVYGSAYLDKPNTKWRGKKLVDRVDY